MTYEDFAEAVRSCGLVPRRCNAHDHECAHWQILGGLRIVNFYPDTRRGPTYYADGVGTRRNITIGQAVAAAGRRVEAENTAIADSIAMQQAVEETHFDDTVPVVRCVKVGDLISCGNEIGRVIETQKGGDRVYIEALIVDQFQFHDSAPWDDVVVEEIHLPYSDLPVELL